MPRRTESLEKQWQRMLHSRSGRWLHLTCRSCGTEGHAASLEIADILGGWSNLKRQRPGHYAGLCVECSPLPKRRKDTQQRRKP
jgi:hypothetical protein